MKNYMKGNWWLFHGETTKTVKIQTFKQSGIEATAVFGLRAVRGYTILNLKIFLTLIKNVFSQLSFSTIEML